MKPCMCFAKKRYCLCTRSGLPRVGQNHIRCMYIYGAYNYAYSVYTIFFCSECIKHTVIHGVYIKFWPTQDVSFLQHALRSQDESHRWQGAQIACMHVGLARTVYMHRIRLYKCMVISMPEIPYIHRIYI